MLCTLLALALAPCPTSQSSPWSTARQIPGFTPSIDTIRTADVNGDGWTDLVLGSTGPNRVSVALGKGSGRFGLPREQVVLPGSSLFDQTLNRFLLEVVDVDGDGAFDLFVAENRLNSTTLPTSVYAVFGHGDGTFGAPVPLTSITERVEAIRAVDLNGDGQVDLALAASGTAASYLLGLGGGQFAAPAWLVAGGVGALDVEVADMDSDGFLDLVASTLDPLGGGALFGTHVFYGDGSLPFQRSSAVRAGLAPQTVQLGDVDLDGDLDIVTSGASGQQSHFIEALPGRAFAAPTPLATTPMFSRTYLHDVNGDGLPDLVDGKQFRSTYLTLNLGQMQFAPRVELTPMGGRAIGLFDEDGDGAADCAVVAAIPPGLPRESLTFFRGTASSTSYAFAAREALEDDERSGAVVPMPSGVEGRLDLLSVGGPEAKIALRRASAGSGADGALLDWDDREFVPGTEESVPALVRADFDGDGLVDVGIPKLDSPLIMVRHGDGAGGYGPASTLTTLPGPSEVTRLLADDLDGDGAQDLIAAAWNGARIFVSQGIPSGGMAPAVLAGVFPSATALTPIDFDLDGDKDLILIDGDDFTVIETLVNAAGVLSFAPPRVLINPIPAMELEFTYLGTPSGQDLNGDGIGDFGYIDDGGTVRALTGNGDGTFSPPVPVAGLALGGEALSTDVLFGDMDENGTLDLVSRSRSIQGTGGWIHWCSGAAPGQFGPPQYAGIDERASRARALSLADLDTDGDLDLVIGSMAPSSPGSLSLYVARNESLRTIGESYCAPLVPNSTGSPGSLTARGSLDLTLNRLELVAEHLPVGSFGYFLCSQSWAVNTSVPGSIGTLCLGGSIGRFNQPAEVGAVTPGGRLLLRVDVDSIPTPNMGRISLAAGQTWHFQAWHRDASASGTPTSNFTDAVRTTF